MVSSSNGFLPPIHFLKVTQSIIPTSLHIFNTRQKVRIHLLNYSLQSPLNSIRSSHKMEQPPGFKIQQQPLSVSVSTSRPSESSSMVFQNSSDAGDLKITVNVLDAKDLVISSGYRYIDCRTVEEFEKGHVDVENVVNISYMFVNAEGSRMKNPKFLEQVSSLFKREDLIVVGCQSGVRSLQATNDLLAAGFKDVKNMDGGYLAWVENAFAIKKPENKAEAAAEL